MELKEKELEAMVKHIYTINKKNHESLKEVHSILDDMQLIVQDIYMIVRDFQADSMSGFHEEEWDYKDYKY